jgi:hypothetical protein
VATGVDVTLTPSIAAGNRQQDRSALISRRFDPLERQEILDPEAGARPIQLGGDGPGS